MWLMYLFMAALVAVLSAHIYLKATRAICHTRAFWRALLLVLIIPLNLWVAYPIASIFLDRRPVMIVHSKEILTPHVIQCSHVLVRYVLTKTANWTGNSTSVLMNDEGFYDTVQSVKTSIPVSTETVRLIPYPVPCHIPPGKVRLIVTLEYYVDDLWRSVTVIDVGQFEVVQGYAN